MKLLIKNIFFILILFHFLSTLHASSTDRDSKVIQWAQQTLIDTLSVSYTTQPQDFALIRERYSVNAWNGLTEFLGGAMKTIRTEQLTLNPVLQGDPQILATGNFSGIHYWVFRQSVVIEEMKVELSFTLTILERDPLTGYPYVVQSLSIFSDNL